MWTQELCKVIEHPWVEAEKASQDRAGGSAGKTHAKRVRGMEDGSENQRREMASFSRVPHFQKPFYIQLLVYELCQYRYKLPLVSETSSSNIYNTLSKSQSIQKSIIKLHSQSQWTKKFCSTTLMRISFSQPCEQGQWLLISPQVNEQTSTTLRHSQNLAWRPGQHTEHSVCGPRQPKMELFIP